MWTRLRWVLPIAVVVLPACQPPPPSPTGDEPPLAAHADTDEPELAAVSGGWDRPCEPNECDDGDPCTTDLCHKDKDKKDKKEKCKHLPVEDGTGCNDGNACTQTDTCQLGACVGANPVTCSPPAACRQAGVCNAGTGQCEYAAAADGTGCNDGDACTQTDTCQQGACAGANPVTCAPPAACRQAGVCNAGTGQCEYAAVEDGTGCNDGDACTQTDTCQQGACAGANPVTCAPPAACRQAGVCNAGTGQCEYAAVEDGTGCNDGDACTQTDICQQGACTGANPVTCGPASECHVVGVCSPSTGVCSNPNAPDGTTCSIGTCQGGVCTPNSASLRVEVYSMIGDPIPGASVRLGAMEYFTDSTGVALIDPVVPGHVIARVFKATFSPASAIVDVDPGATARTMVRLLPQGQPLALDPLKGGEVARDNVTVSFPSMAVVDSNGAPVLDGVVEVSIVQLDPATAVRSAMPGPLVGLTAAGREERLASVLMAEIELWRDGEQLQLAPGAVARLELVLPDSLQGVFFQGQQIPAWWFDLELGLWREEGMGTVQPSRQNPDKQAWVAEVNHFTWWNIDFLLPVWGVTYNCFEATVEVEGTAGDQIAAEIQAIGQTSRLASPITATPWTRYEGSVAPACLNVPYDTISQLSVRTDNSAYIPVTGFTLVPPIQEHFEQLDINHLDAHNPAQGGCTSDRSECAVVLFKLSKLAAVRGRVTNGPGGPGVVGATVFIQYDVGDGPVTVTGTTDGTGRYCLNAPARTGVPPIVVTAAVQTGTTGQYSYGQRQLSHAVVATGTCSNGENTVDDIAIDPDPLNCRGPIPTCKPLWNVGPTSVSTATSAKIAADKSGNVYVTGSFRGDLKLGPCPMLSSQGGSQDAFLIRLTSTGGCAWAKSFGGTGSEVGTSLALDSTGNVIITGHYQSVNFGTTPLPPPSAGGVNGFVAKFTTQGTLLWDFPIEGEGTHFPMSVAVDASPNNPDPQIVVGGYYSGRMWSGGNSQGVDGFSFFMNQTGALIMYSVHTFGGTGTERVMSVAFSRAPSGAGDVFMTGDFNSSFNNFDWGLGLSPDGYTDGFVARLQNWLGGSPIPSWIHKFGGGIGDTTDQKGVGLAVNSNNDVVVTGVFNGNIEIMGQRRGTLGVDDVLLFKINATGTNLHWLKTFGGGDEQRPSDVAFAFPPTEDVILAGSFFGSMTFNDPANTTISSNELATFMTRLDSSNGVPRWVRKDGAQGGAVRTAHVAAGGPLEGQPYMAIITQGPADGSGLDLGWGILPWTGGLDLVVARFLP